MSPTVILFMICALIAGLWAPNQTAATPGANFEGRETPSLAGSEPSVDAPLWTTWGASQYALADDGASIWIGSTGGLVRWDKQHNSHRRYSAVDGLPHSVVLAAAVDAAGNRWFGGDGGLSLLDAAENWTHFRQDNSGLFGNQVVAIAVVGGDTLYASHGLPSGTVSRRDPDGGWSWFPNRETAIQTDYVAIVQARAANPLWAVAGKEVWAGSRVFDGARWQERPLPDAAGEAISLAVDSHDHVWALTSYQGVYEWDGAGWLEHPVHPSFSGKLTALAVDSDDRVWVGLQERAGNPYTSETAAVIQLSGAGGGSFDVAGPVAALLPAPEGLWGAGPGWLMTPDFTVTVLTDGPRFRDLPDALLGGDGSIWFYSGYQEPYTVGAVQTLDDRGTLSLEDDVWRVQPTDYLPGLGYCEIVTAFERGAGDTWYAHHCQRRVPSAPVVVRYHAGEWIEYTPPLGLGTQVSDIFAQDQHHVWFAAQGSATGSVLSLDDGGTPTDTGDDVWQTFPISAVSGKVVVAVDARGRLWHGQPSGLYRHDGSAWQSVYDDRPICDLAPAADGTLYAQVPAFGVTECAEHSDQVLIVQVDGAIGPYPDSIARLIAEDPETVRTARRRNSLWTVASDGAIWYISHSDSGQELQRRSSAGLNTYALPVEPGAVRRLEVDARGHVWLAADSQLWRMAGPRPIYLHLPMVCK